MMQPPSKGNSIEALSDISGGHQLTHQWIMQPISTRVNGFFIKNRSCDSYLTSDINGIVEPKPLVEQSNQMWELIPAVQRNDQHAPIRSRVQGALFAVLHHINLNL
jgi:hypothetical protein